MFNCVKTYLFSILIFFRIVDAHDRLLSITNIALLLAIYKIYVTPALSMEDLGIMMTALLNYSYKKYINIEPAKAAALLNQITPEKDT